MKRVTYQTAEQLCQYCLDEGVDLVVEYLDEERKQRQVILKGEKIAEAKSYLAQPGAMAYYRKDGIFYEVVAGWKKE